MFAAQKLKFQAKYVFTILKVDKIKTKDVCENSLSTLITNIMFNSAKIEGNSSTAQKNAFYKALTKLSNTKRVKNNKKLWGFTYLCSIILLFNNLLKI
jgi:hypothetical protein